MRHWKRIFAGALAAAVALTGIWSVSRKNAKEEIGREPAGDGILTAYAASEPAVTALPGVEKTEGDFNASYFSVTGFAKGSVNDRTQYIGDEKAYRVVKTENEFLQALDDAKGNGPVQVIEVAADLNLGWDHLSEKERAHSCISEYGWEIGVYVTNPSIRESNVSQLTISDTEGLTIFSRSGNTVEHAEWKLQGSSSDIILRNICIDGMWHWSEAASSKEAGWTPLKLNGVKGVWIDHCSTTLGADGNMDSENGASNMTASWNNYGLEATETPSKNSMLYKTISYLEELYKQGLLTENGRYTLLRQGGATPGQIMAYSAYHQKLSLNGSGDKDFKDGYTSSGKCLEDGNQRLHITYAYDKVNNIGSRFPLIRQGTAHVFNCVVDDAAHMALHNDSSLPFGVAGGYGLNRAHDARNGACIGADTNIYREVRPITGNEKQVVAESEKGKFGYAYNGVYNHVLIVNSMVERNGQTYIGSSWDNNGDNLFPENPSGYWIDKSTIGDFKWYSSIVDEEKYKREVLPTTINPQTGEEEYCAFTFAYSDEGLPYSYQTVKLEDVESTLDQYAGAYTLDEGPEFWLRTEYKADEKIIPAAEKNKNVKAEALTLSAESMEAAVGEMRQIDAYVSPSNASNKEVSWTSSDESIAEVIDSGLVIVKKAGTATITATTTDGTNLHASCTVEADKMIESIRIETPVKKLYLGENNNHPESCQLTAVILPEDATKRDVVWSSSNERALLVDANGVLTPVAPAANVMITCTSAYDSSITATVKFAVKAGVNPDATPTPQPSETLQPSETPQPTEAATEEPGKTEYWMGDVDLDGTVTAEDALAILKHVVNLQQLADAPEALPCVLADMDHDGTISAVDALCVLKTVVKLIDGVHVIY